MDLQSLDYALVRWSVTCQAWGELSSGNAPDLKAFLAGWLCNSIEASIPEDLPLFRDSFNKGWLECESAKSLQENYEKDALIKVWKVFGEGPTFYSDDYSIAISAHSERLHYGESSTINSLLMRVRDYEALPEFTGY